MQEGVLEPKIQDIKQGNLPLVLQGAPVKCE